MKKEISWVFHIQVDLDRHLIVETNIYPGHDDARVIGKYLLKNNQLEGSKNEKDAWQELAATLNLAKLIIESMMVWYILVILTSPEITEIDFKATC